MSEKARDAISLIYDLNERAKELDCLYKVDEALQDFSKSLAEVFNAVLSAIPPGWQYPDITQAKIIHEGTVFQTPDFEGSRFRQSAEIFADNQKVGEIHVYYTYKIKDWGDEPFLREEYKLLTAIADRLGNHLFHRNLKQIFGEWQKAESTIESLKSSDSKLIKVLMNADLSEIADYLQSPSKDIKSPEELVNILEPKAEKHWKWRLRMASTMVNRLGTRQQAYDRFGIRGVYVFGSAKNANSGPGSDIDLIIHFAGNEKQKHEMLAWFEGWSFCLSEMNQLRTGYETDGLLDLHIISDEDIEKKTSFAAKIGAVSDSARPLEFRKEAE